MTLEVEKEIWIDAGREIVFDFLTQSELLAKWIADEVQVEPRPGGRIEFGYSERATVTGRYSQLIPPSRVVFELDAIDETSPELRRTLVEITLYEERGGTRLRLRHSSLVNITTIAEGWQYNLERLAQAVAGKTLPPNQSMQGS